MSLENNAQKFNKSLQNDCQLDSISSLDEAQLMPRSP